MISALEWREKPAATIFSRLLSLSARQAAKPRVVGDLAWVGFGQASMAMRAYDRFQSSSTN